MSTSQHTLIATVNPSGDIARDLPTFYVTSLLLKTISKPERLTLRITRHYEHSEVCREDWHTPIALCKECPLNQPRKKNRKGSSINSGVVPAGRNPRKQASSTNFDSERIINRYRTYRTSNCGGIPLSGVPLRSTPGCSLTVLQTQFAIAIVLESPAEQRFRDCRGRG